MTAQDKIRRMQELKRTYSRRKFPETRRPLRDESREIVASFTDDEKALYAEKIIRYAL